MHSTFLRFVILICGIVLCSLTPLIAEETPAASGPLPDVIEFNRDIRPVLSDNCYFCHGPDKNKREAELRLDTKE
ncbi:MAG TPA: hypothetical protein PLR25_07815, partial [Planctomycetaceae bacterium]|nr:hypothetical protein [Planctomycetaceae bacterium]